MTTKLKAPFSYFGGKSRVAPLVWSKLGDVNNYIEPFCGTAAMLLGRPHAPRIETINDADCYLANFWLATQHDPESVAYFADGPVNEAHLHARHRWLVLSSEAKDFRRRMRSDPTYYDVRFAGWWCWGLCCWIGGGWCAESKPNGSAGLSPGRCPQISGGDMAFGHGVHKKGDVHERRPRAPQMRPKDTKQEGSLPGVHGLPPECRPKISGPGQGTKWGDGIHAKGDCEPSAFSDNNRPQIADAFSRGRGVNSNDEAGTCEQRRLWLCDWFGRLRDRLRTVRVCCGDWLRVCDSESVTTRLGTTGIFFDPPYGAAAGRDMNIYAVDSGSVAADVLAYCIERGSNPMYRIALCGYAGEGHEPLETAGWEVVAWKAQGGYGNRSAKGKANAGKERIWFSPHCSRPDDLFTGADESAVSSPE